jgi:hypothetical protein
LAQVVLVHGAWHGAWCWDFVTEPDADTLAMIAPQLGQTIRADEGGTITIDPAYAADVSYGSADPAVAAEMVARLRPLTLDLAAPPEVEPAWKSVPATYVVCSNDHAIQVDAQREMAQRAETVLEWPTDHSPFLTRPADVAELAARYLTRAD